MTPDPLLPEDYAAVGWVDEISTAAASVRAVTRSVARESFGDGWDFDTADPIGEIGRLRHQLDRLTQVTVAGRRAIAHVEQRARQHAHERHGGPR
jgi:hypothetical protein